MTFAAEKIKSGREPIEVCELDLDYCEQTFGRFLVANFRQESSKSEEVTNGDFAADITGWTDSSTTGGSLSWDAGQMKFDNGGAGTAIADQQVTGASADTPHELTTDHTGGSIQIDIGSTQGASDYATFSVVAAGPHGVQFFLSATSYWVRISNTGAPAGVFHIDNVSSKEAKVCAAALTDDGTVVAGGANWIWLAATASSVSDTYNNQYVRITGGAGAGQEKKIDDYFGATRVAMVESAWTINPDATSVYSVHDADGVAQANRQCFNTRKSCQDPTNYSPAPKIYRYCEALADLPEDQNLLPVLTSVKVTNTKIDPGRGLGVRAKVIAELRDFPYHDIGVDKYVTKRTYAALDQGTYFAKLLARNPYYQGRPMRIRSGFITDPWDWTNFEEREYVIERIEGPSAKGVIKVTGKDILKLADDKRARVPIESAGRLAAAMDTVQTTATMNLDDVADAAVEYPTTGGTWRINDEIMIYAARSATSVTGITRAQAGTIAAAHAIDDGVQLCKAWSAINIITIIKELLEDFASVASAFIPFTDWTTEKDSWLVNHNFTRTLSEPTGVNTVLSELLQISQIYLWWDEVAQEIKLKAVRPPGSTTLSIDDDNNIVRDSFAQNDNPDKRISRIDLYYNPKNQIDVDEVGNYQRAKIVVDANAESSDQYNEKRAETLFAPWFTDANAGLAITVSSRLLSRYRDNPRLVKFELDAKDSALRTGDQFLLSTDRFPEFDGTAAQKLMQVIRASPHGDRYHYEAVDDAFGGAGRSWIIGPDTLIDYASESDANKALYSWISQDDGQFADGTAAYEII